MSALPMPHLRALMPEIEAADAAYNHFLETCGGGDDMAAATATYNEVLKKAVEAIYLDTADRNSRSTIEMVYRRPADKYATIFGINPVAYLKQHWLKEG